ncbi:MAG TPA: hypothetical protein ENI63_00610 [Candidatus Kaiserbacteria bacterium]|nr:hypothetical protein [Candidatus Kaiserbacteria bacterium]
MYNPSKPYKAKIFELIKKTWNTPLIEVKKDIYPVFKEKISGWKVDHTDGIGTKGDYHWSQKTFKNAVLDALAMNLNDLALVRAIPYKLQNHIILPEDNHKYILEIVEHLSKECQKRHIVMTGGETSIHNNITSLDISMTVSGFIKDLKQNMCKVGDVLIGIRSNGLHSNGFTKVRELFGNENREEFTRPTHIYLDEVLNVCDKFNVNGMMHITGGSFTKLKDITGNVDIKIYRDKPHKIFYEIYNKGVTDKEMYTIFNCGIGFILSVPNDSKKDVINNLTDAFEIGEVVKGKGNIIIESSFSENTITL